MNLRKKTLQYLYTQWLPWHWLQMTGMICHWKIILKNNNNKIKQYKLKGFPK